MTDEFYRNIELYKRGLYDYIFFTDKVTNQVFKYHPKQIQAIEYLNDNTTSYTGYGGAARGGKSALIGSDALFCAYAYPECANLIGRKNLTTLWETTWKTLLRMMINFGFEEGKDFKYNGQRHELTFTNKSLIVAKNLELKPSDTEATEFGSLEILRAYIDQSEHVPIKIIEKVGERVGSHFTTTQYGLKGKVLEAFNPSGSHVKRRYWTPFKTNKEKLTRKFVQALPSDNPGREAVDWVNQKEQDFLDGTMSNVEYQKQIKGNFDFDDDRDVLCSYDNIVAIFKNNHLVKSKDKYITCDIARRGSDKAIIAVWCGWIIVEFVIFDISLTTDIQSSIVALRVKHQIPKHHCVGDEDGVGGGVIDNTGIKGFINGSTPLKENTGDNKNTPQYKNLKTQCGYYLAKQINKHQLFIEAELSEEEQQEITEELEQLRSYKVDDDQKLKLKPKKDIKEDIGRSPDWLDTLLMRSYFDIGSIKPISVFNIIKEVPEDAIKLVYGLTFNQSNQCLIEVYIKENTLFINEVFCEDNVTSITEYIKTKELDKSVLTVSSRSSSKELRELSALGFYTRRVKESLFNTNGIKTLNSYQLMVTESSKNLVFGLENWFWSLDDKGDIKQEPEGITHDTVKALVYAVMAKALWEHLIPKTKKSA